MKRRRTSEQVKWAKQRKRWCRLAERLWRRNDIDVQMFMLFTGALGHPWVQTTLDYLASPGTARQQLYQLIEYTRFLLKLEEEDRIGIAEWIEHDKLKVLCGFYKTERERGRQYGKFFGMDLSKRTPVEGETT